MKPIHKRPGVILDLVDIYAWISERNPQAADDFLSAVESTFEQIRKHPGIGWSRPWRHRKLAGIRSWRVNTFKTFLIFYREEQDSIEIHAVLRAARHLERALRKR